MEGFHICYFGYYSPWSFIDIVSLYVKNKLFKNDFTDILHLLSCGQNWKTVFYSKMSVFNIYNICVFKYIFIAYYYFKYSIASNRLTNQLTINNKII